MQRGRDRVFLGSDLPSGQGPGASGMDASEGRLDSIYLPGSVGKHPSDTDLFDATGDWLSTGQKHDSFTYILLQAQGKLVFSIRESAWAPSGGNYLTSDYWEDNGTGPQSFGIPHYYLALNSLGVLPGFTPKTAMEFIGKNINDLFALGGNSGGDQQSIKVGDVYWLTDVARPLPWLVCLVCPDLLALKVGSKLAGFLNQVEVVFVADFFFIFKTRALHLLDGIAIHGVFQDRSGEFWMFQEGYGSPNTSTKLLRKALYAESARSLFGNWGARQYWEFDHFRDTKFNYAAANRMWHQFAEKSKAALSAAVPKGS